CLCGHSLIFLFDVCWPRMWPTHIKRDSPGAAKPPPDPPHSYSISKQKIYQFIFPRTARAPARAAAALLRARAAGRANHRPGRAAAAPDAARRAPAAAAHADLVRGQPALGL